MTAAWLLAAVASAAGCSSTVDGAATCPGCGNGTEPDFPTTRPGASSPMPTPVPEPPSGGGALAPNEAGYVYIETKSGLTRCQLTADAVGCEAEFENSPSIDGFAANGVNVTADGTVTWVSGNLGDIPTVPLDYRTYTAVGWTIEASTDGTRFTNDGTGHGMVVRIEGVETF